ncbi:hypothetical protein Enr13x_72080 [Stieleria neptunia]|uniref:Uncharacterized protein n=1 Tax=Stieleria neptunia TaxID=2527979 RepID=A0A518I2F7_9BACT|nr:hypothetical protein [Stieleria neptunia]QDV47299.1 hypothetical protein Enr13x_72080 [Stieleria neptunia]
MAQMHTYCDQCRAITVVESLKQVPAAIDHDAEMLAFYEGKLAKLPADSDEARRLRERIGEMATYTETAAKLFAELQANRRKPQRCLRCDNTDVEIPDNDHPTLRHRPCTGVLSAPFMIGGGVLHPGFYNIPHTYNVDGDLIEIGKKVTPSGSSPLPLWWVDEHVSEDLG